MGETSRRTLVGAVQLACDACTHGVMDQTNPHFRGLCECRCHLARAECTWGDGPDVLVVVPQGSRYAMMAVDGGHSFGMESRAARALAESLLKAADIADELERGLVATGSMTGKEE